MSGLFSLFGVLWTPVAPTLTEIADSLAELGLWSYIEVGLLIGIVILLWRRLRKG